MNITSQITVSIKPELSKTLLHTNMFKPGSTLRLKVLELWGDRALIDFGRFQTTADIKIPVTLGEELMVRVIESGKQLKMSVINLEGKHPLSTDSTLLPSENMYGESVKKIHTDLRQILKQTMTSQTGKTMPQSIYNILNLLNSYFEPIDLNKLTSELVSRLKLYLENSGVFFEKTLEKTIAGLLDKSDPTLQKKVMDHPELKSIMARDLKANLLMLRALVEGKAPLQKYFTQKALMVLKNSIYVLLTDITQQQGRAVGQSDPAEPFQVFTYTLPLKERAQTARLKVYYQKKQPEGSKKQFQISLLLSMDRLGDLRTDFFLLENDLNITFFVKNQSTKTKIQENCLELKEMLDDFFDQVMWKVVVSEKKVMNFDHENVQTSRDRRVDLRI